MIFSSDTFFRSIDKMDATTFANFFHPDGSFTFANHAPSKGREAISQTANSVFSILKSISHHNTLQLYKDGTYFFEGKCVYHKLDNKIVELPYVAIADTSDGLITSYRTYIDPGPLFGREA